MTAKRVRGPADDQDFSISVCAATSRLWHLPALTRFTPQLSPGNHLGIRLHLPVAFNNTNNLVKGTMVFIGELDAAAAELDSVASVFANALELAIVTVDYRG